MNVSPSLFGSLAGLGDNMDYDTLTEKMGEASASVVLFSGEWSFDSDGNPNGEGNSTIAA